MDSNCPTLLCVCQTAATRERQEEDGTRRRAPFSSSRSLINYKMEHADDSHPDSFLVDGGSPHLVDAKQFQDRLIAWVLIFTSIFIQRWPRTKHFQDIYYNTIFISLFNVYLVTGINLISLISPLLK